VVRMKDDKFSKPGTPIGVDLPNITSSDARKVYERIFRTRKGLYGKTINVEEIDIDKFVEDSGPSYIPSYIKGTELEGMPYNYLEIPKWIEIIKRNGGIITADSGWPLFKSHTERSIRENYFLYAIYTKEPFIITRLQEKGLLVSHL
jgi:hypothetical protein